jgi:heme-degrading monooxygenase HmoA
MFSVIFEVHPKPDQWDAYLDNAKMLRPELEQVDGFIDNIRYKSLTRDGWILSLSGWRDEKSVVRWRTKMRHHMVQEKGRSEILLDYHLRVGQITHDTRIPEGYVLAEQRLDETEVGEGTTVTLVDAECPLRATEASKPADFARYLGLSPHAAGLIGWDIRRGAHARGSHPAAVLAGKGRCGGLRERSQPAPERPAPSGSRRA